MKENKQTNKQIEEKVCGHDTFMEAIRAGLNY